MKIKVDINNLANDPVEKSFLKKVIKKTFDIASREKSLSFLRKKNISVSVALVPSLEIKRLNKTYRKKEDVTDVLSFPEYESRKELIGTGDKEMFLGEIILCYNYIREYARKNHNDEKFELAKALSHGILHLLGFRHGKLMFEIQEKSSWKAE